jgi:DNA polymerase delta subunit 1
VNCTDKLPELFTKHLVVQQKAEEKFAKLWTQCQRCQGSLHEEVLCNSHDCPIFYMRRKAWKDLNDASAVVKRFDVDW